MSADCAIKPLSPAVITAYQWICAISGSLSISGSSLIIYIILRGGGTQLLRTKSRLLLGMSIVDICSSTAYAFSIMPTPQVTGCSNGLGNISTCAAQGFFLQLGLAGPAYNAMLSIYFLMTIRYSLNRRIIAEKYELLMHLYAITPVLVTAIIGVAKNMYFGEGGLCWFGDVCTSYGTCSDGNGWGSGFPLVIFSFGFTAINAVCTVFCMLAIYWTLHKQNLANRRHVFQPNGLTTTRHRRANETEFAANQSFKQAFLYFCAFLITYIWMSIIIIVSLFDDKAEVWNHAWYYCLSGMFRPLQGMWNFFAFVRPVVCAIQRQERNDSISFFSALKKVMIGGSEGSIERRMSMPRVMIDEAIIVENTITADNTLSEDEVTEDDTTHIEDDVLSCEIA